MSGEKYPCCPLCGASSSNDAYSGHSGLLRCQQCGIIYNPLHRLLPYNDDYFTDEYRAQYGRTYEEDFDTIYRMAERRLAHIESCGHPDSSGTAPSLLDIGCALGFFMKAASERGFAVQGVEVSSFAAEYCRNTMGMQVFHGPFEDFSSEGLFDVISAWYVIEHWADPAPLLHKIFCMLREGGVFSFSIPSVFGPLYRFNRREWAETHPVDHRIDLSPGTARKLMKQLGFRNVIIRPGGIHPERVISEKSLLFPLFRMAYRAFSHMSAFSDTMEVYAVK